jgi:hypothetical protein
MPGNFQSATFLPSGDWKTFHVLKALTLPSNRINTDPMTMSENG